MGPWGWQIPTNPPTIINLNVTVPTCCCRQKSCGPSQPTGGIGLSLGDTYMAIKFTATVQPGLEDENISKSRVHWSVVGSNVVLSHDTAGGLPKRGGGTAPVIVPKGADFDVWATHFDQDGNESMPTPSQRVLNAQDKTAPSMPAGMVAMSQGDWVADPSPNPWDPEPTTEPPTEEPTTEEPTTEEPTTEEPTTEEPTTEEPTTEEPTTEEPTTEEPTTEEPTTEEPTTEAP